MEELPVRVEGGQVTFLEVVPGVIQEAPRLEAALRRLSPNVVCIDAALADVLKGRESWYATALRACLDDHGHRDAGAPQLAAAKTGRALGAEVVPLLGAPERPGFFARRRAVRALTGGRIPGNDPRGLARAARIVAADADLSVKRILHLGEESMARRLGTMILDEQRTRVAFVVAYPRSERVAGLLLGRPVATEVAQLGHGDRR